MFEQRVQYLNVAAGEDMTVSSKLDKAVTLNGTIASTAATAMGILKSRAPIGAGIRVADQGVIKAYAGAAISTVGYPVTVTTSGFIIATPAGSGSVGKAFVTAASGDLFAFQADFANAF